MSMVLTRSPLVTLEMNGGGTQKRRSARLSQEGNEENEPPAKRTKANGSTTATVSTKQQDGDNSKNAGKRKKRVYDEEVAGFTFSKGKRGKGKETKEAITRTAAESPAPDPVPTAVAEPTAQAVVVPVSAVPADDKPAQEAAAATTQRKIRRRLPVSPESEPIGQTARRSKRLSNEKAAGKERAPEPEPLLPPSSGADLHANVDRRASPGPGEPEPITLERKRKRGANGVEEEKVMTISLPFADTPIIRRNREMRKNSAESSRRSSAGMRGRRASSLIDEGRGHALPHTEVPSSEFFKHISADLTEPRRMRCLLGWCASRSLPNKPDPPQENSPAALLEFQAQQTARVIQDEVAQDLITKGALSDWFSRDEGSAPLIPQRKKANPRNVANATKVAELESELQRLNKERAEWEDVIQSAATANPAAEGDRSMDSQASPLRADTLDSPQRAIFDRLQPSPNDESTSPSAIEKRLRIISENLEFAVDQFAHGVHALSTTRETAERVAEKSLADAAQALEDRERQRAATGKAVKQMDALRGLAKVLNAQHR